MQTLDLPILETKEQMEVEDAEVEQQPVEEEPIFQLAQQLTTVFDDASLEPAELSERIQGLMGQYTQSQKDWEKYCFFSDLHYTRNLVCTSDKFELIVLCWKPGQASRIHNHAGSNCWMGILQGPMVESLYHKVHEDGQVICERAFPSQPGTVCPNLQLTSVNEYQKGQVAYIHDGIGLHRVAPGPVDGVTLHCYSPPISIATLFDTETNTIVQRTPGFYSIGAKRMS